jgi:hypothetical protein
MSHFGLPVRLCMPHITNTCTYSVNSKIRIYKNTDVFGLSDRSHYWISNLKNYISIVKLFIQEYRVNIPIGRAIAEAVSRWLPTAAAWVHSRVWSSGICGGQSGGGQIFSEYFGFPCHSFHQILHPHNHPGQVQ